MKCFLTIIVIFFSLLCFSQAGTYRFPEISSTGKNINNFVPAGWTIRDTVVADFNKDGVNDIAFVIETKEPFKFVDTTCFSTEPFFPKILIVLFERPDKSLHQSILATKLFGNCNWGVQGQDPYVKINERRNSLGITFLTGGTIRNYLSYYFRFQNNDWYLIGAESQKYWAGHTDDTDAVYNEKLNLLTGVREMYNEDAEGKNRSNHKTEMFDKKLLIKLSDFSDDSSLPFIDNN